jgi:hypothetical protein
MEKSGWNLTPVPFSRYGNLRPDLEGEPKNFSKKKVIFE